MDLGESLGHRLVAQDESALADAYAVYAPAVLAYLRRYVGPDEAEDVAQRTFLDVWRHADRYRPEQRFSSWLFTLAHHRAVDALRARRHTVVDVDTLRDLVGEDGRETAERHAEAADLHAALDELPLEQREVLLLAYVEDLTQREIAERLGVPLGTVKARAARGTKALRALMTPRPDPLGDHPTDPSTDSPTDSPTDNERWDPR